jgi:CRP-like cAMP-binding protein
MCGLQGLMPHRQNQFLARLGDKDFLRLEPHLSATPFALGKILCEAEADVKSIWFPHSGVVSQLNILEDGSEVECCTMGNETAFGIIAASEPGRSFTRDVVQIAGHGSTMSARAFRAVYTESPELQAVVHGHIRAAVGFMTQSVACNARHKIEARLCRWLLTCADYVEGEYLPLTQEFIAAMLGVQRTTVTDAASGLQDMGIIRVVRGKVTILDAVALGQRSCECYAVTRGRIDALLHRPIRHPAVNGSPSGKP